MTPQDVISLARQYINDPSPSGRWSNAALLLFVDRAVQTLSRDVKFPEGRASFTTVPGQQEYDGLPVFVTMPRVYINGQLIIRTDLNTLEGHQIELYDQGFGTMPGNQAAGSGGPPGTQGNFTPAWNIQQPSVYPVPNSWGLPAPRAEPWMAGQRPRYYMRSGVIGFVPAPSGQATVTIDGVFPPEKVTLLTQELVFDRAWMDVLTWHVVMQCKAADDSDRAAQQYQMAQQQYSKFLADIRVMVNGDGLNDDSMLPKFITQRSFWQKGNNRNPGPWTEYP